MHVLYQPHDPHDYETLRYLAEYALESPQANMRVQMGTITLSCTANTPQTASVTFSQAFNANPIVLVSLSSLATPASQVTVSGISATVNGFTAQAYSSVTQSITLSYLAIGQV